MTRILTGSIVGAIAGFLARPCRAVPMALSLAGASGSGWHQVVVTHRIALMTASISMLGGALSTTFWRQGGSFSKILAASATLGDFRVVAAVNGSFLMFRRAIWAFAMAGCAWLIPSPASAQMT